MRKLILILSALLPICATAGNYRGMFEIGGGPIFSNVKIHTSAGDFKNRETTMGGMVSTSHGYQINRSFFIGGGFGVFVDWQKGLTGNQKDTQSGKRDMMTVPLFADARWDLDINRKFTPYADLRVGYQLGSNGYALYKAQSVLNPDFHTVGWMCTEDGVYLQVSTGGRVKVGNNLGINFGLTYIPILKRSIFIEDPVHCNRSSLLISVGIDFQGSGKSTTKESKKERLRRLQQRELEKKSKKYNIQ